MQFLLSSAGHCEEDVKFLELILPEVRGFLGADAAAVARATPLDWLIVGCSGCLSKNVPTTLAAAALDQGNLQEQEDWSATPLSEKYALLVRGHVPADALVQLQAALSEALLNVQNQQHRSRRIRRLEKILEITHAWSQTNCMESLLQAMAETATELLAADRASIFLWDKANKTLVGRPALGLKDDELRIPDDTGIVGQVIQTGEPRRVGGGMDEDQIARAVDKETGYHTSVAVKGGDRRIVGPSRPNATLSRGIRVGDRLFLSGITGRGPDGYAPGDVKAQTRQALETIKGLLAEEKMDFTNVVRGLVWVTDIRDFQSMNEIYREFLPSPAPARATVGAPLMSSSALVEIMMVAVEH